MTELPTVTVVTPSYNQGRFIRETVESVLSQDYPRVEYLVIDGGSTDETLAILRDYESRLVWVSEADRGQSSAINKGWRRGRGEIVAWLNSDDTYLPGAISTAVSYLSQHPEVGALYGEGYRIDEEGRVLDRCPTLPFSIESLKETCFICQPTAFLRRRVVEEVGYLDESLHFSIDYDLWIRLARVTRFACVPAYLAAARVHRETKTLARRQDACAEAVRVAHRHFGSVAPAWIYAYAKARAERDNRGNAGGGRVRFLARLGITGLGVFLRYNRCASPAEVLRWLRVLGRGRKAIKRALSDRMTGGAPPYRRGS